MTGARGGQQDTPKPPEPYYADDLVTLFHAKCEDVLPTLADASVDCVITDAPYSERTHRDARSNSASARARSNRVLSGLRRDFGSITEDELRAVLAECGRASRGWVISSLDYRHAFAFETSPPEGLRLLRIGVWLKTDPMPQISADRPAIGWEAIAFLHRTDTPSRWNGGGKAASWYGPKTQAGEHPTAKPIKMVANLVRLFTAPGGLILDPYAGSGTTLRAAKDEGRKAIGCEQDEAFCEVAAKRLSQGVLDFGASA